MSEPDADTQLESEPAVAPLAERLRRPTAVALVAANVLPLLGVVLLGWDLREIMVLFWAESAVIGVYNVVKMIQVAGLAGVFVSAFFTVHYGIFMLVHLMFILALTSSGFGPHGDGGGDADFKEALSTFLDPALWVAVAGLFISHGISYHRHFVRGVEPRPDVNELMSKPYVRIVVMHLSLLLGAFAAVMLGVNVVVLALLVVLKTGVDLAAHLREHRKATS